MINDFASTLLDAIEGTTGNLETGELIGGARIRKIFEERFVNKLDEIDPVESLTEGEILVAIYNSTGLRPALGVPQVALEHLVKKQLKSLEESVSW